MSQSEKWQLEIGRIKRLIVAKQNMGQTKVLITHNPNIDPETRRLVLNELLDLNGITLFI